MIITEKKVLHQESAPTSWEEVNRLKLIDKLKAATPTAWVKGYGLAAIQIGIPLRFAWFQVGEREYTLLNPEIVTHGCHWKAENEGCLSCPDQWIKTNRATKIRFRNTLPTGEIRIFKARGLLAKIIQHEIDHMNGKLITDKEKP